MYPQFWLLLLQVLSFVQSLPGELIPSLKFWFQHHLLLQGFSSQLYPPSPTCLHSLCQSSPPTSLITLSISYLIATLDFILVNTVSIAPRGYLVQGKPYNVCGLYCQIN